MKRALLAAAAATVLIVGPSCGGDGTGPVAGNLQVRLTSPNSGADSAIVLTITGPAPLTGATPGAGLRVFHKPFSGTSTRFALTGRLLHNELILTIGVADVTKFADYRGTIQGVAQPNYQLRALPGGYALAVTR